MPSRRLAAVWFADIVGYSTLSSTDEATALELLRVFKNVSQGVIEGHQGRLVQFIGDAAFAEFSSTDGAVRAALRLRSDLARAWEDAGLDGRIRVGLHVGDVVLGEDGDLYGEGINVAARLCDAAGPGQLLASQDVWRQLRQLRDLHFSPAGERELKGIAVPVFTFAVDDADAVDEPTEVAADVPSRLRLGALVRATGLLALAATVVLLGVRLFQDSLGLGAWIGWTSLGILGLWSAITLRTAWIQSSPARERRGGESAARDLNLAEVVDSVAHLRAPRLNVARLMVGGAMAFAVLFAVAGLWVWAGAGPFPLPGPREAAAAPDPALIVLPFDSAADAWSDGLPELLALAVDGVSGIRVIDPRVVRTRTVGVGADSTAAVRVGRSLGARFAAVGAFQPAGDQASLSLDVYDVDTGALRHRAVARGDASAVPQLVERVAAEVLSEALPDTQAHPWRIDAAVTPSVPALLAYLRGMSELRSGNWPMAFAAFDDAVTADSTFALARYRRAFVRIWTTPPHILFQDLDARIAAEQAGALPERERLMVEGYYQTHFRLPDALATLRRLTRLYPDDPEGWFLLGDALYHLEPGRTTAGFEDAFRRTLDLAPDFGPAYPHLVEAALERGDSATVRQLVAEYRAAEPSSPLLPGLSWAVRITRRYVRDETDPAPPVAPSPAETEFRAAARGAELARSDAAERIHSDVRDGLATVDSLGTLAADAAEADRFEDATDFIERARDVALDVTRASDALHELDRLVAEIAVLDSGRPAGPLWERGRALADEATRERLAGAYGSAVDLMRRARETLVIAADVDTPRPVASDAPATAADGLASDDGVGSGSASDDDTPGDVADPPVVVQPDVAVAHALTALRSAIEAESLELVRDVWVGITPQQEAGFERLFESVRDLTVTFDIQSVAQRGDTLLAAVETRYAFYAVTNRRPQATQATQVFEIERRGEGWVIVGSTP